MPNTFFLDEEAEHIDQHMAQLDKQFWRAFYNKYPEMRDLVKPEWIV